jgi:hypothetical protein
MLTITFEKLRQVMQRKQYRFFDQGDYNLNLIGIRSTQDLHANTFNDLFCIAYSVGGAKALHVFACTTDPGVYYRANPLTDRGTAILAPGHYSGLWKMGLHKGQYQALVQASPVALLRDNNRDQKLNFVDKAVPEMAGINCHRATGNGTSTQVDKWSAGCQVIANSENFNQLISLCNLSAKQWGNLFSYTLLEDKDIDTHF